MQPVVIAVFYQLRSQSWVNSSVYVIPGLIRNLHLPENNGFRIKPGMTLHRTFYEFILIEQM
jgi:hypothetical protein